MKIKIDVATQQDVANRYEERIKIAEKAQAARWKKIEEGKADPIIDQLHMITRQMEILRTMR